MTLLAYFGALFLALVVFVVGGIVAFLLWPSDWRPRQ